ncbi:hypothetical protein G6F23_015077 [Rhizopus arrhizus]|nr:hypothetical protein G6F23_015077 [Rhizopus arrhizus]
MAASMLRVSASLRGLPISAALAEASTTPLGESSSTRPAPIGVSVARCFCSAASEKSTVNTPRKVPFSMIGVLSGLISTCWPPMS